jgi:hypothetical protein
VSFGDQGQVKPEKKQMSGGRRGLDGQIRLAAVYDTSESTVIPESGQQREHYISFSSTLVGSLLSLLGIA